MAHENRKVSGGRAAATASPSQALKTVGRMRCSRFMEVVAKHESERHCGVRAKN
ncbi:MAG: hypothetical protein QGM45_09695 [Anaerolineales bacterium]|nr:hypothetical protein [Anaerolineales bacterium]